MKVSETTLQPAPKRGQYDRALSRQDRQAAQRERVIAALATLSAAGRVVTVASVVEFAGIGRNTFYEYFDDIEHALVAIRGRALREFSSRSANALQTARTPLERIRVLARAWAESLAENPSLARLALQAAPEFVHAAQLSTLAQHLVSVLGADQAARSALPGLADPLRVTAVAAAFDAVSRVHAQRRSLTVDELQHVLSDVSLRLLR